MCLFSLLRSYDSIQIATWYMVAATKLQERDELKIKPLFLTRLQVLLERFGVLVLIFFHLLPNLAGIWNKY